MHLKWHCPEASWKVNQTSTLRTKPGVIKSQIQLARILVHSFMKSTFKISMHSCNMTEACKIESSATKQRHYQEHYSRTVATAIYNTTLRENGMLHIFTLHFQQFSPFRQGLWWQLQLVQMTYWLSAEVLWLCYFWKDQAHAYADHAEDKIPQHLRHSIMIHYIKIKIAII